jgi:hypothetical protein
MCEDRNCVVKDDMEKYTERCSNLWNPVKAQSASGHVGVDKDGDGWLIK